MPESCTDRPTSAHEHVFLFAKSPDYYYDAEAISEPATHAGRVVTLGEKSLSRGQARGAGVAMSGNALAESVTVTERRNIRDVWTIPFEPYSGAHFATMPPELALRCIKAGSREGDAVLDPFGGSGTTGMVADGLKRHSILVEINPKYAAMAARRVDEALGFWSDIKLDVFE